MGRSLAHDPMEETLREPLAVTCYLPVANLDEEPTFSHCLPAYEPAGDTGYMDRRPERVIVRPLLSPRPRAAAQTPIRHAAPRREPVRRAAIAAPPRKVSPRSSTVVCEVPERLGVQALVLFWSVALAGSLAAIGIALASW